ncbi:melanoma-associated antigen 10-like [Artibeus jamaicensis]|uniref:melanoma-associated antigen 10-like n=1 Tax=Artibeus jamaicensis TaxID=9417 RepID=UPI00235A9BE3|nr:melanoma-associated antigen 10-like [Artibeus jamaicensis]
MSRFSKHPRLTAEPSSVAQSEMQLSVPREEEEEESSCSFSFSYLSSSSSTPSSPVMPGTGEEEEEEKEEEEKDEEEEEEEEEEQEQPAAQTPGPPLSPQRYAAQSMSDGASGGPESEETSSPQASADPDSMDIDPLEEKVANLVHFMVFKYRLRRSVTREELLKVVKRRDRAQFPVIFQKACKCLEVISGVDVKEVDPATHSYVLVNSLDLTYDEMLGDLQSMPKNGLLIIILGLIFLDGNCALEQNIWEFLSMLGVYPGRKHFIYGEPRKLITEVWVRENYLLYQQVPDSDPPRYTFMWGPRAHAETSKLQVLEFLAKIKGTDPTSFSCWYEEALRDDREKAEARAAPRGRAAAPCKARK